MAGNPSFLETLAIMKKLTITYEFRGCGSCLWRSTFKRQDHFVSTCQSSCFESNNQSLSLSLSRARALHLQATRAPLSQLELYRWQAQSSSMTLDKGGE